MTLFYLVLGVGFIVAGKFLTPLRIYENGIEASDYITPRFIHWSNVVDLDDFEEKGIRIYYLHYGRYQKGVKTSFMIYPTFPRYDFIRRYILSATDGFPGGFKPTGTSHIEIEFIDVDEK